MQNETVLASAVKVTAVNTGAAISMVTNTGAVSAIAGMLAATYSAIQIFKALPWITVYIRALREGVFKQNWKPWNAIGKREELSNGDDAKS